MRGYFYNNGFAHLKLNEQLTKIFPSKESHKSDFYSLLWIKEGMVDLMIDGVLVPVNSNQMTFITPLNYVQLIEERAKINILQFNREFYCIKENDHEVSCNGILYFGTVGIPVIDLDEKEIVSFDRLLGVLEEEFKISDTIQEEMLRAIVKRWLIKSTRILKHQNNFIGSNEVKTEMLRQFKILLEQNFKKYHKVNDYAKLLNKAPKTLANQFKLLLQESPSRMIQQRIVVEAKRFLMYSNMSIKEIAFDLGFEDAATFSHYFKTKTSVSPQHFKNIYHNS